MIRSKTPALCAAIALLMSANAFAENLISTEKIEKLFPAESADSVWIDNPFGNIEVVGSDSPGLAITAIKTVTGPDRGSLKDGSEQTDVSFEGDRNVRLIRTILPRVHNGPWTSSVSPRCARASMNTFKNAVRKTSGKAPASSSLNTSGTRIAEP